MQIDLEIIIAANALAAIIINFIIINSTCGRVLLAQEVIVSIILYLYNDYRKCALYFFELEKCYEP